MEAEKEVEQKILNKWKNIVKDKADDDPERERGYKREAVPVKKAVDSKEAVAKASSKWLKSSSKESDGTKAVNGDVKGRSVTGKAGAGKVPEARGVKPVGPQSNGLKSNSSSAIHRSQSVKCGGLKSNSAPAISRAGSVTVKKPYVPYKPGPKAGSSTGPLGGKADCRKGGKPAPSMGGMKGGVRGGKFPF